MPREAPSAAGLPFAICVAGCAAMVMAWLVLRKSPGDAALESAVALFGWQRLLVVHLACALPACAALACAVLARGPRSARRWLALGCLLAGAATALAAAALVQPLAAAIHGEGAGFAVRAIVRSLLAMLVELPWFLAVCALLAGGHDIVPTAVLRETRGHVFWTVWATIGALALPAAFAWELTNRQTVMAADLLEKRELVAAERIVARLCELGSARPIAGASPVAMRRKLAAAIDRLDETLPAADAPRDARQAIERGRTLAMLDRRRAAREELSPWASTDAEAALLLAAVLERDRDFAASSASYKTAARLLADAESSPSATSGLVRAYTGMAFTARELGQPAAAEGIYQRALAEVPSAAAYFHFQLGKHYELAGRPLAASEQLRRAADLAPDTFGLQAEQRLKHLSAGTPGCLFDWRKSSGAHATAAPRTSP